MAKVTSLKENQQVYVLHTYPFKETSLIVEIFSKEFGRVSLVAKGARRPKSALRGMLQSFQALEASWSGIGELKTLHGIDLRSISSHGREFFNMWFLFKRIIA